MLKLFFLLTYLGATLPRAGERWAALASHGLAIQIGFLGVSLAAVGGLVTLGLLQRPCARWAFSALFAGASFFQLSVEAATGGPLNFGLAVDLFHEGHQIGPALVTFGGDVLTAGLVSLCLFLALALTPPARRQLGLSRALGLPLLVSLGLGVLVYQRGGEGAQGLPAAYPPLVYAGLFAMDEASKSLGTRPGLIGAPTPLWPARDLVLIVDESVSANYLDVTNADGVRSGLMAPRQGTRVVNFGYAAAISMCSTASNRVLRFGGSQQSFPTAIVYWPSIWRYARRAGLRTVYIDAQLTGGARHNRMTAREQADIDRVHQFDGVPVVLRDQRAADLIAAYVNNGRPDFIYVNKAGAHFPLSNKYPAARTVYRPVPPLMGNIARAFSDAVTAGLTRDQWRLYRNAYRNALSWQVGAFFDRLLAQADLTKATIVYTSDHGQDLHERGNPGSNTHCGLGSTAQEQGVVPLALIEGAGTPSLNWDAALAANRDRATAFRIFPTLLALMGYDRAAIRRDHGRPLDEPPADRFAFVEDVQPLGGKPPRFRPIDRAEIVRPPRSDFLADPFPQVR